MNNETNQALQDYNSACNALLKIFCEKHEYDYEEAKSNWIGGEVGGMTSVDRIGDMFINMEIITTDLSEDAPKDSFEQWYWYDLDCQEYGLQTCNYRSWLHGCPRHSNETLERARNCKKKIGDLTKEFQDWLAEMNNELSNGNLF